MIGHHSNFARCCLPGVIAIEPLAGQSSVLLSQLLLNYGTHGKSIQRTTVPAPMKLRKGWLHKMYHLVDLWLHLLILSPFQEFQTHSSPDLSPTSQSCSFHVPELAGQLFCRCIWVNVDRCLRLTVPNEVNKLMYFLKFKENVISTPSFRLPLNRAVAWWLFISCSGGFGMQIYL